MYELKNFRKLSSGSLKQITATVAQLVEQRIRKDTLGGWKSDSSSINNFHTSKYSMTKLWRNNKNVIFGIVYDEKYDEKKPLKMRGFNYGSNI